MAKASLNAQDMMGDYSVTPETSSVRKGLFGIGPATFGLAVVLSGAALADDPFRYSGSEISEILQKLPDGGSVLVSDLLTADDVTRVCLFANDMPWYDYEVEGCVVNRDSLIVVQETRECSFVRLDGIRILLSNPESECRDMSATLELLYLVNLGDNGELQLATILLTEPGEQ